MRTKPVWEDWASLILLIIGIIAFFVFTIGVSSCSPRYMKDCRGVRHERLANGVRL